MLEVVQGDFTTTRLVLAYIGEALMPLVVLGLCAAQWPRVGRLGVAGAVAYAYAWVFFSATVLYALVAEARDYEQVTEAFGASMTLHGAVMVLGGAAFGAAVVHARLLPAWTGWALGVGAVAVAAASGGPTWGRALAAALPAAALAGMGLALLRATASDANGSTPADPRTPPRGRASR